MALDIKSVRETVGSRKATLEWQNGGEQTTQDRVFLIVANSVVTDINELIALAGDGAYGDTIPEIGEQYPSDPFSTVHGLQPLEIDGYLTFNMMVRYRIPDAGGQNSDPTENDWIVSTDFQAYQKIVETTTSVNPANEKPNGVPVQNSAGDPFLDPLQEAYSYTVINASKWFDSWDLAIQAMRQGATNRNVVTAFGEVFPVRTLRCTRWTTSGKQDVNGGEYYQLQAQFIYKPVRQVRSDNGAIEEDGKKYIEVAGWDRAVVDQGFREISDVTRCVPIQTRGGTTQTPIKLNLAGGRAPCDKIFMLPFQTTYTQPMEDWDLPDSMP